MMNENRHAIGPRKPFGQPWSKTLVSLQNDIAILQRRKDEIDRSISANQIEQERLQFQIETSAYNQGKKELRELKSTLDGLARELDRVQKAIAGANHELHDERQRLENEKEAKKIANATEVIIFELKHLHALARRDLGYTRGGPTLGDADPQRPIAQTQMTQYAEALQAIADGRIEIRPDDTIGTFFDGLDLALDKLKTREVA